VELKGQVVLVPQEGKDLFWDFSSDGRQGREKNVIGKFLEYQFRFQFKYCYLY
jgi:hypothetical protein